MWNCFLQNVNSCQVAKMSKSIKIPYCDLSVLTRPPASHATYNLDVQSQGYVHFNGLKSHK